MTGYPETPWQIDPEDQDGDERDGMFRVIRDANGQPIFFVSRWLSNQEQEDVSRLVAAAPKLLQAARAIFFAKTYHDTGAIAWGPQDWNRWRGEVGPILADLWPSEWDRQPKLLERSATYQALIESRKA